MKKIYKVLFITAFFTLAITPFALMPFFGFQAAESDASDVSMPLMFEDHHFNSDYFTQLGDFFSKKFAFRQQFVTANATLMSKLTHTSAQANVIEGKEDYLFYGTTLDDYEGKKTMNDHQIANAVYNLKLMQETLKDKDDVNFTFTIAPNKNSLYGQYMPSGYKIQPSSRNATRLKQALKHSNVHYVDLYSIFHKRKEVLYQKTDSHWNNKGAALVQNKLLTAMHKQHTNFARLKYDIRHDMQGDLYKMLYPAFKGREAQVYYKRPFTYKRIDDKDRSATTDDIYQTKNKSKKGSLLMFRDSFGNTLTPFMAEEYHNGLFLKGFRYELTQAYSDDVNADDVVIELVERNLVNLSTYTPLAPGKDYEGAFKTAKINDHVSTFSAKTEANYTMDGYRKLSGHMNPKYLKKDTTTYVHVYSGDESYIYKTYHASEDLKGKYTDDGYGYYIDELALSPGKKYNVSVIYQNGKNYQETQALGHFTSAKGE